ncbi:MAG: HAMP domain-containing histidine kinase [Actinomycetota bacterium]|nr:HAMP domain-containing histidine kinase [Actinomycetota bacterium]
MTVRRRLVIGMLAILGVLVAAIGVAEILVLRHALYQRSAQGLRNELRVLAATPPPPPSGATGTTGATAAPPAGSCAGLGSALPPGPPGPGGKGPGHAGATPGPGRVAAVARALAAQSIASAIARPDGSLLTCAAAGRRGQQSSFTVPASMPAKLSATTGYVTVQARGRHLLAVSQPFGHDQAILVTDIADDDSAVSVVLAVTVLGGLAALAAAGILSVPLLRTGLAPLRKVATTADAIAGGDLDQRAGLERSADEIGQLGAAFDRMVDRLQGALVERDTVVEHLRTQDQVMRRFLADASHELRTPLTAIRGGAQVLRLGSASNPHDLAETLGHIQTQTERMSRLVDDLLTLSRQEVRQPASRRELTDLGALVADHGRQRGNVAPDHPITVNTEAAWVMADADALSRVCANLLENAQKYTPEHTEIALGVTKTNTRVELSVADQGPGIPIAERQKVFERFYRGDPARSRSTGGAGLGLAIVAAIVADHEGAVHIHDNPGGGTKIVLDLPLAPSPPRPELTS